MLKRLAAFAAVIGIFVAMNAVYALAILGVFKAGQWLSPTAMDEPLIVLALGTAVIVGVMWGFSRIIAALRSQSQARDPAH